MASSPAVICVQYVHKNLFAFVTAFLVLCICTAITVQQSEGDGARRLFRTLFTTAVAPASGKLSSALARNCSQQDLPIRTSKESREALLREIEHTGASYEFRPGEATFRFPQNTSRLAFAVSGFDDVRFAVQEPPGAEHAPPGIDGPVPCVIVLVHTALGSTEVTGRQGYTNNKLCPPFLRQALWQARQYNELVYVYEEGTACKAFADRHGIGHDVFGRESYMPYLKKIQSTNIHTNARSEFIVSFIRFPLLLEFAEKHKFERIFTFDPDTMVFTDVRVFSRFFRNYEFMGCFYPPQFNNIASTYTARALRDFISFMMHGIGLYDPLLKRKVSWMHDMHALHHYFAYNIPDQLVECWGTFWDGPNTIQRKPGECANYDTKLSPNMLVPKYRVANTCAAWKIGTVVEALHLRDTSHGRNADGTKRVHFINGQAMIRFGHRSKKIPMLAAHLQGSAGKGVMINYLRPAASKDPACQKALKEDCTCDTFPCKNCYDKIFGPCEMGKLAKEWE